MLAKTKPVPAEDTSGALDQDRPEVLLLHANDMDQGGILAATIFYACALKASGHSAEIWTPSRGLEKRASNLGIPVFYHKGLSNAGTPIVHPAIVWRALKVRRHVKAIVHQGEKHWLFGRLWLRGKSESVVFHNDKIGQRRLFRQWLALSERHRHELELFARRRGLSRSIAVIRNGPLPDASRRTGPRPVKPIEAIGGLSNFGGKKGMDILIRAFAEVRARGNCVRLVLAGDGQQFKTCQALAAELSVADEITWLGWQWDTRAFFDQIDLFCLPSRNEPFGIVITEAMQAGLPVIATDTSGPRDIVLPGETGWLVPVGAVSALADALIDAINNPARTAAFGAAGSIRYQDTYSLRAAGQVLAGALGLK